MSRQKELGSLCRNSEQNEELQVYVHRDTTNDDERASQRSGENGQFIK